ncbi:MAG: glycosyltransferase, partial [Acidobacteriota bacterium]|nr:glycosyltransferase [Acidobacteriota bacterium]
MVARLASVYLCYFGLRQPLVQTQVLPYLRELASSAVDVALLTFEPKGAWDEASAAQARDALQRDGITWYAARYHKRPTLPATLYDIAVGALRAARIARKHRATLLHARSHVPAMMALLAKKFTGAKVLFDIRGLLADEYADAGHWKREGLLYRLTKAAERALVRNADGFVVLTERARRELFDGATKPLEVIPCCTDAARFAHADARARVRGTLNAGDRIVIAYTGSLGGAYLTRELAEFFAAAKSVDARVFPLVLTQSEPAGFIAQLEALGFAKGEYFAGFAPPEELPEYLAAADIAIAMLKPTYSKLAMSPTKFAEYLASGLPVIVPKGIGDLDEQVERERVGVLFDGFDAATYRDAFTRVEA